MSLFKARDFWTVTTDDSEEQFDHNSLKVTRLNSDSDYIIVGSHSGVLRIFKPSTELCEDSTLSNFRATDVLIEKVLDAPIFQIESGKLVSGSNQKQIAVLQPRNVCVYALVTKEGAAAHGTQHTLQLLYEHKLRRTAANFVVGPFGGSQNREFICVQSLDGMLTVFEQESFAFCTFLPDFLLPGPLAYLTCSDTFITASSDWQLSAFRYKTLFEMGQNSSQEDTFGKKVDTAWVLNIGEPIIDIKTVIFLCSKESIVVLGERNMYVISDKGKLTHMKHFDYSPVCFSAYSLGDEDRIMTMVVSETSTLLIYNNTTLKWSAQLSFLPISIARGFLHNVKGAIVTLSEDGTTQCSYLGTEPSLFVAPPLNNQDIDFENANLELADLNRIVRSAYQESGSYPEREQDNEVLLKVSVNKDMEMCTHQGYSCLTCLANIEITPKNQLEDVQITVHIQKPIKVIPEVECYSSLNEKTTLQCSFYADPKLTQTNMSSLFFEVIVTYTTNIGVPGVLRCKERIPLNLAVKTCQPQKDSAFKIILTVNQSPAPLNALFSDFMDEESEVTGNSVAFKSLREESIPVTILLAKTSERYRLQSDCMLSLNVILEELIFRLRSFFAKNKDFTMSFTNALPTAQVLQYVNYHFDARQRVKNLEAELTQLGAQFRLIQKRLISKFKVKNPTPLSGLELLLNDTFDEIINKTSNLQICIEELKKTQIDLSCVLNLVLNLIRIMGIPGEILPQLESAFFPMIEDIDGQNWEDTVDASMCYLLRTTLAKSEKDKLRAPHTSFEEIKEVNKVEKHITQVLDRLQKSGSLLETHFQEEAVHHEENDQCETETIPIGSQIGQSSSRILSAKKGLLRRRHKLPEES